MLFYPCKPANVHHWHLHSMKPNPNIVAELSMKGVRCIAHHHHGRLDLWSWARRLYLISAPLVELRRQIIDMLPDGTITDGVWFGRKGIRDRYYIFDIPEYKGKPTGIFYDRRILLLKLWNPYPLIEVPEHSRNPLLYYYTDRNLPECNGIILKDLSETYDIRRKRNYNTPDWIKIPLQSP